MTYLYLGIAIVAEVIATSALKASQSFTKLAPSLIVVAGYGVAFYCMSACLDKMSVGIVYAIWSGLGIVLVTVVAAILYKQIPDMPALVGMALIVAGVIVINIWSNASAH